ncbi:right-handed parallel beta-helix repeat-containing protein [Candidatus Absconditicoccus praedator]|uniref:right-handed parallel beta-helix repeat-containing protein n=1 Tax=Candidatus Absconditicoccus praedator TaxID=2735562 RepID=UPI001E414F4A|nr:right-handed parallel beta-helix repeat-containing protein [Candidatus Absconditicoccus praedator]UFX83330.1 right-handed parallel beta-helix repeat-containing protein [Candidatus Absconditicoccus praedator]
MISIISNMLVFLILMTIFALHFSSAGDGFAIEEVSFVDVLGKDSVGSTVSAETNITSALNFFSKEYQHEFDDLTPHNCRVVKGDKYTPEYTTDNLIEFVRGDLEEYHNYNSILVNPGSRGLERVYDSQTDSYIQDIADEQGIHRSNIDFGYVFGGSMVKDIKEGGFQWKGDIRINPNNSDQNNRLELYDSADDLIFDRNQIGSYCENNGDDGEFEANGVSSFQFRKMGGSYFSCEMLENYYRTNDDFECNDVDDDGRKFDLTAEDGGEMTVTFENKHPQHGCTSMEDWDITSIKYETEGDESPEWTRVGEDISDAQDMDFEDNDGNELSVSPGEEYSGVGKIKNIDSSQIDEDDVDGDFEFDGDNLLAETDSTVGDFRVSFENGSFEKQTWTGGKEMHENAKVDGDSLEGKLGGDNKIMGVEELTDLSGNLDCSSIDDQIDAEGFECSGDEIVVEDGVMNLYFEEDDKDAGEDECDITVSEGESIQDAIDDAQEGYLVCVESGTYQENLEIDGISNLTLIGLDENDIPILDGTDNSNHGIEIKNSDNISLKNLQVQNFGNRGLYAYTDTVILDDIEIYNIISKDNGNDGIRVIGYRNALIENSESIGNNGDGITFYAYGDIKNSKIKDNQERGIYALNVTSGGGVMNIYDNELSGNLRNNGHHAAAIEVRSHDYYDDDIDEANVVGNDITDTKGNGILIYKVNREKDDSYNSRVADNTIDGVTNIDGETPAGDGILIYKSHYVTVENNTSKNNDNSGVRVTGTYNYGTYVTTNVEIAGNDLINNEYGILIEDDVENIQYGNNNFEDNQIDVELDVESESEISEGICKTDDQTIDSLENIEKGYSVDGNLTIEPSGGAGSELIIEGDVNVGGDLAIEPSGNASVTIEGDVNVGGDLTKETGGAQSDITILGDQNDNQGSIDISCGDGEDDEDDGEGEDGGKGKDESEESALELVKIEYIPDEELTIETLEYKPVYEYDEDFQVSYLILTKNGELIAGHKGDTKNINADISGKNDSEIEADKLSKIVEFFEGEEYQGLDDLEQMNNIVADYSRDCSISVGPDRGNIDIEYSNLYNVFN